MTPEDIALLKPPSSTTLKKYGLTEELWLNIVKTNDYACPICGRSPPEIKFVIDHEHVRGFNDKRLKKKLFDTPDKKRRYCRNIVCANCNLKFLPVGMTSKIAKKLVEYLETYENRKNTPQGNN